MSDAEAGTTVAYDGLVREVPQGWFERTFGNPKPPATLRVKRVPEGSWYRCPCAAFGTRDSLRMEEHMKTCQAAAFLESERGRV